MGAISEEKEDEEKVGSRSSIKGNKESATSSALAGVKNLPKTFSGLGKKVKESKTNLKVSNQSLDKEKAETTRRVTETEKEAVKYLKDDITVIKPTTDEMEFKRIERIITDKEKVSLVSDSLKANDVIDSVASNGATKGDSYNEVLAHNAVHVSSV